MESNSLPQSKSQLSFGDLAGLSRLFDALGDPVQIAIVARLLEKPATQKELREEFELPAGPMSRRMSALEDIGVARRQRSHGPYEVRFRQALLGVLRAASDFYLRHVETQVERTQTALLRAREIRDTPEEES